MANLGLRLKLQLHAQEKNLNFAQASPFKNYQEKLSLSYARIVLTVKTPTLKNFNSDYLENNNLYF